MVEIINAQPEHAAQITAIWNPVIRNTFATFNSIEKSEPELKKMVQNRPCFLVAMDQDSLIGFATFDQFRGGIGYAHSVEHTVMVAPEFQGCGAGHHLMTELEKCAKSAQHHVIMAGICALNDAGLAFHAARGFEKVGYLPQVGRKENQWLDLVLMQKML